MAMGDINYCCERSQVCNMAGPLTMIEVTASLPPVTDCDCKWSAGVVRVVL